MAIYIKIERIKTLENKYYYEVSTTNFGNLEPFFIAIDSATNLMYVSKSREFQKAECVINLTSIETMSATDNCTWLPSGLLVRVVKKVYEALQTKEFGKYIDYCA